VVIYKFIPDELSAKFELAYYYRPVFEKEKVPKRKRIRIYILLILSIYYVYTSYS